MFMLLALLVACSNTANQQPEAKSESEAGSQNQAQNSEQKQSEQNNQNDQTGVQEENPSSSLAASESSLLNESEQQIYDALVDKLDKEKLVGLEPLSVAKLYVQASLDGQHDLEYFLYTTREGHVQWSKEEYDQDVKKQGNDSSEEALEIKKRNFQNIEKGTFIETSDYEGYIKYEKDGGDNAGFQMIQDEDGIWKVAFMPIQ